MELSECFPLWNKLTDDEKKLLERTAVRRRIPAGTVIHDGNTDCLGLLLICSGQLRAYILSDEGKEVTVYRLFEHDICLFSASCILRSIQFEITISVEKDIDAWLISLDTFEYLMKNSLAVSNYVNEVMGSRLTDIMWLLEQILWKSFDRRLASFLSEECYIEKSSTLKITHEQIASHMGTAREVVTRMLKYFQTEGMVKLTRGSVEITDKARLEKLALDKE